MFNFYIIYTPHTALPLSFLVHSLLKHSPCQFRLVSNECPDSDQQVLKTLCSTHERLTFLALPTRSDQGVWPHGEALDYLYKQDNFEYFCFMDSDIFATGPFIQEYIEQIKKYACISSCSSIWMRDADKILPDSQRDIAGRFNQTQQNLCLGSSYFAIYQCSILNSLAAFDELGFKKHRWEQLAPSYQKALLQAGLKKERYDTAKCLNLLLHVEGQRLHFAENSQLVHLGGISAFVLKGSSLQRNMLTSLLLHLPEGRFKYYLLCMALRMYRHPKQSRAHQWLETRIRKSLVATYFNRLLSRLEGKSVASKTPPVPYVNDDLIQSELQRATQALIDLNKELVNKP